jgi:uncharacterized protein (DUF302 family)
VLQKDVHTALMLPCPIVIYTSEGETCISTMLPTVIEGLFPGKDIGPIAQRVEEIAVAIVEEAAH